MKSFLIVLLLHSIAMCCYVAVCCHVKTFNACHKTNTNITINEGDCPLIVWTICSDDGSIHCYGVCPLETSVSVKYVPVTILTKDM